MSWECIFLSLTHCDLVRSYDYITVDHLNLSHADGVFIDSGNNHITVNSFLFLNQPKVKQMFNPNIVHDCINI